jgi:hypothetical protein
VGHLVARGADLLPRPRLASSAIFGGGCKERRAGGFDAVAMQERTNEGHVSSEPVNSVTSQLETTGPVEPASPDPVVNGRRRGSGIIRRWLWLDERIGSIAHAGLPPEKSGWLELEAAREARDGLSRLGDLSPTHVAVLTLRRLETLQLMRAILKRQGIDPSSAALTAQDWKNAASVAEFRDLRGRLTEGERISLEAILAEGGESYLTHLDAASRRRAARTLGRTAQHLIGSFVRDREAIERLRFQRWLRIGLAALMLVTLLGLGARWLSNYRQKGNLAFHRSVTASSTLDIQYSDTARLVDGDITNVGFHTTGEDPNPSATIDLGTPKRFSKVVVYNRADCCQERSVPAILEVSADGVHFRKLAEREVKFDKWTIRNLDATGRYVRLRRNGGGYFHFSEVEIYE